MANEEKTIGIYGIWCLPTKKWYVGASHDVDQRLKMHRSEMKNCGHWHSRKGLYQDAHTYGIRSFTFVILERCDACRLKECEQKWINTLDSVSNGYNTQNSGVNRYWRQNGAI